MGNLFFLQLGKQTTAKRLNPFSDADHQAVRHSKTANIKPGPFEHSHRNFTNPLPCSALFSCGRIIQKVDFCPAKGYIVFEKQNGRTKIPN